MKIYKDLNDLEASDIDNRYKKIMQEKPNFDKRDNSKLVYRRKDFIILSTGKGFIIHNKKYDFDDAHTHIGNSFSYAKSIIDLSVRKKMPNRPTKRLIESLLRVNRDSKYIKELEGIRNDNNK